MVGRPIVRAYYLPAKEAPRITALNKWSIEVNEISIKFNVNFEDNTYTQTYQGCSSQARESARKDASPTPSQGSLSFPKTGVSEGYPF